jgi:hypothetical protein
MSASTGTAETGSSPASAAVASERQQSDLAGLVFRRLTVLPTLLAMAWLLAGLPLLLLGLFTPLLMLVISLPLAVVLVTAGMRWVSGRSLGALAARGAASASTPWWVVAALVAVAVIFGIDQLIYHSQEIIVFRDPASYIQFGNWIAKHGSLPIPQDAAAFGGYHHGLFFGSAAFYERGHSIIPQFMAGLPMVLAPAFWIGGVTAATAMGALLGACGVLAFGGLVGRLVGPRWAPLGALVLALSLPEIITSRSTYSEPLTQILFLGGLCLVIDSFTPDGAAKRKIAALGGLAIGLTLLVRIDGASDMLPLIPYFGLLLLGRQRQAWPLIAGTVAGSLYGILDGVVLSRPYLGSIKSSLLPLLLLGAAALVITVLAVLVRWDRGLPELRTDRLPNVAAALACAVALGLAIRPYVQKAHTNYTAAQQFTMRRWQTEQHLPIQPTRDYYELSMHWVFWYIGLPAVLLGTVGAAILVRRCLRGGAPAWTLPLMCFAWIIVATLLRPGIIPDQPWASRRLVAGVLPGFIVLAIWATSWIAGWLRERAGAGLVVRAGVVAVIAAALILPAVKTTFGIAHKAGGPLGTRLVAVGLADKVTSKGEIAAVDKLCSAIPRDSSVLFVSYQLYRNMAQDVRGMCGVPTALALHNNPTVVGQLIAGIQRAGRRPVLLASNTTALAPYNAPVKQVMDLHTQVNAHALVRAPVITDWIKMDIWMSEFPR